MTTRDELLSLLPSGRWFATIGIIRKLGHPEPSQLGTLIGGLIREDSVRWAEGYLSEFPSETWALVDLSDEDWKALKTGADRAGGMGGMGQIPFKSFISHAHRKGVKDAEIRYMKAFHRAVVDAVGSDLYIGRLQLLRRRMEVEDRRVRA